MCISYALAYMINIIDYKVYGVFVVYIFILSKTKTRSKELRQNISVLWWRSGKVGDC